MGRKKKYQTEDEKHEAQKRWMREYYYRNRERLNKERMERYYELQKNTRSDNSEGQGKSH